MKQSAILAAILMSATLILNVGCRKEGAAEKVGQTLDGRGNAPVRDAVEKDGVGERLGKKLDKAVLKAVEKATD
jgi:hypothetical protein